MKRKTTKGRSSMAEEAQLSRPSIRVDLAPAGPVFYHHKDPLSRQVGGTHYKDMAIQPLEFIMANNIGHIEACVIRYVCRHKEKGGAEDIRKAIHYLEILLASLEK